MSMFDFDDIWDDFFVGYTVTRFGAGSKNSEGKWVIGTPEVIAFEGMPPQPLDENDLKKLEDGEKVGSLQKLYTSFPLRTREGAQDADRVTFEGHQHEVIKVDTRDILGNYYKAVIRRVQGDS